MTQVKLNLIMKRILFILCLCSSIVSAQASLPIERGDQDGAAPSVFLIGQNERSYEKLLSEYNEMLLTVCENDMNVAYAKWIDLLVNLETYAEEVGFDINGIKIWINVFWNPDGTLEHIVYHPKPNSRNMDTDILSAFFEEFSKTYKMDISHPNKFSHYGSAAFPTFPKRYKEVSK